jgi:hypothetical protein
MSNMPPNIAGILSDNWQYKRNQHFFLFPRDMKIIGPELEASRFLFQPRENSQRKSIRFGL